MVEREVQEEELAVVGHQTNFKIWLAQEFDEKYRMINPPELKNSILTPFLLTL